MDVSYCVYMLATFPSPTCLCWWCVGYACYLTLWSYFLSQEAQVYAEENGLLIMETSAKTAMNVNDIFLAIGKTAIVCKPQ